MFVFEDIITMDDRSVQRFVRDCDPRDLVLALKTANVHHVGHVVDAAHLDVSVGDDAGELLAHLRLDDLDGHGGHAFGTWRTPSSA